MSRPEPGSEGATWH